VHYRWQYNQGSGELAYGAEYLLWEKARLDTPLPWSGIAPRDYPPGSIEDADRAAGRTPLARIQVDD
jgi:hypothetical protein